MTKNPAAVALGRLGGSVKSEAKTIAARANGKKGGRPKEEKTMTTPETMTDAQLVALRREARTAGDLKQAAMCDLALRGNKKARIECARVIADAEAHAS